MKYTTSATINKPLEEVVALYKNPDNYKYWMQGLARYKHLSGTPDTTGAKSEFIFQQGKRKLTMVQTIISSNLPEKQEVTYEAKKVFNKQSSKFEKVDESTTKYTVTNHFKFKGFMKMVAFFMPTAFRKQTAKYLNDFKTFVENHKTTDSNE